MMCGELVDGRYRLVNVLGVGGMGTVWRAVDERLDRRVAVKIVPCDTDSGDERERRFVREARAAGGLSSPHIVTVHDVGNADTGGGRIGYLVMELLDGTPLNSIVAAGLPTWRDVADWGEQICRGLQVAHAAGVVHRDIKPSNVLLSPTTGTVTILDFGIARPVPATPLTRTGCLIGTPAYMSPEQVRGEPVDGRSDLYSLGCLLHHLLTGAPPFQGSTWSVLTQHLQAEPVSVRSRRGDVPPALDRLILALLRKDRARRPANAANVARQLARILLEGPTTGTGGAATKAAPCATAASCTTVEATRPREAPFSPVAACPGHRTRRRGGHGRWAGVFGGALAGGQWWWLTDAGPAWSLVLGVPAALAIALAYDDDADPVSSDRAGTSGAGLIVVVAIAFGAMVGLFVTEAVPWWGAVLVGSVSPPALLACSTWVRSLVRRRAGRTPAEAETASTAGLVNGALVCALLSWSHHAPLAGSLAAGAAMWLGAALGIGAALPRRRATRVAT
jgi:hypothetical protein